jgi:hypothetical protein
MKTRSPKGQPSRPPKISSAETKALRLMRKLYTATRGEPQRWESLTNLGAVKSDAAAIVYAVEMGWLNVTPRHDPHSLSLTEAGRRG